jgi:hypothetical protein
MRSPPDAEGVDASETFELYFVMHVIF